MHITPVLPPTNYSSGERLWSFTGMHRIIKSRIADTGTDGIPCCRRTGRNINGLFSHNRLKEKIGCDGKMGLIILGILYILKNRKIQKRGIVCGEEN